MRTAVFLMNLGGPRTLAEVEPYLYDLFSDPAVLSIPLGPARRLLARLISHFRAPSSAEKYQLIGGRSPLVEGTEAQARALQAALGPDFSCHLAMRCGHPNTAEGVAEALAAGAEQAVALPLYPQWANATTRSSLEELRRRWPRERPLAEVCTYHDHAGYLDALGAALAETLERLTLEQRGKLLVVFSAHGLPMSQVRQGDPYPDYVELSARGAAERAGVAGSYQVTYQSRVGPVKWLGPDTVEFLREHARGKAVVTVPVAFVSEHLETLYDLDILARAAAEEAGAAAYFRVPALGTRPAFIEALADVVRTGLAAARPAA
ncbi:MAG TPA: ferrochelatase [Anaeromyxobacteraceae bacterium]|jgi:ferrochelatase|nr:ferrochelatase [Anaeromyxobacteraceae bacterium]